MIVTEHRYGTEPLPWRFPVRNRVIAALADVVVVVEATASGGTSSTVQYADLFGRRIYAVPGSRRNPAAVGCNALIRDGATMLFEPADLLVGLGRGGTLEGLWAERPEPDDRDQRAVLRVLAGEPAAIDEIERRIPFPVERLGTALRALETASRVFRKRGLWWPA
jgi:DNA processing protein